MKNVILPLAVTATLLLTSSLFARDLTTNLVFDIPLNETETILPADSTCQQHPTATAIPTAVEDYEKGWCRSFLGNTTTLQTVNASTVYGNMARTISFWAFTSSTDMNGNAQNNVQFLLFGGDGPATAPVEYGKILVQMVGAGNTLRLLNWGEAACVSFNGGTTDLREAWHHIVFTIPEGAQASGIQCYLDGQPYGTAETMTANTLEAIADYSLNTVQNNVNLGHSFTGLMSEFKLYDVELTAEEVATLYGGADGMKNTLATANSLVCAVNGKTLKVKQECDVEIFDITGRLVYQATAVNAPVKLSQLSGAYIVRTTSNETIAQQRVIF